MIKELDGYDWAEAFGEGNNYAGIKPRVAVPKSQVSLEGISRKAVKKITVKLMRPIG